LCGLREGVGSEGAATLRAKARRSCLGKERNRKKLQKRKISRVS